MIFLEDLKQGDKMIKFKAETDEKTIFGGKTLLGLGLSKENVEMLKKGNPIHVNLNEMGIKDVDMLIFYGETEEDMQRDLAEFIGPDTKQNLTHDG